MKKFSIFAVIVMFLSIYEPPLTRINILHLLGGFSWLYILANSKSLPKLIKLKKTLSVYFALMYLWAYLLFITLINNESLVTILAPLYWMIYIIPISIMLSIHFSKKKFDFNQFMNAMFIAGTLQGLLAVGAFLFPIIQTFFVKLLIARGHGDVIQALSQFRMYGLASNLTFSTPVTQSFLSVLSIWFALNKNWRYILFLPLLLFSAIINARISLVVFVLGLTLIVVLKKNTSLRTSLKTLTISLILIIILFSGMVIMEKYSPNTYDWVVGGIDEIKPFFVEDKGSSFNYYSYFTGADRYALPEDLGLLFGVGTRVMTTNKYGVSSDIGYINDIWLGGLLYSISIYSFFLWITKAIYDKNHKFYQLYKFICLLLLCTLILANIKGYIFTLNNFTTMLFIMFGFIVLKKENVKTYK